MVLSPELLEEWRAHRSSYSNTRLTSMYARRKVERVEARRDESLALAVSRCAETEAEEKTMAKDLFLVEAALAADGIIVSRDDRARDCFRRAAVAVERIRHVVWANPVTEELAPWLEGQSSSKLEMTLGRARRADE